MEWIEREKRGMDRVQVKRINGLMGGWVERIRGGDWDVGLV